MKSTSRRILKGVSFLVVSALLSEQLAFANPDLKPIPWGPNPKPLLTLELPKSIALIEDTWQASQSAVPTGRQAERMAHSVKLTTQDSRPKTIYLIQDAHTNESGQRNVAKALDLILGQELRAKGEGLRANSPQPSALSPSPIKYIFLEAGQGDDSLSFLRDKGPLEKRKQVAESFLKKGVLSGSEYLDLTSNHGFTLWGVENKDLYWKSIDVYKKVTQKRDGFQEYLKRIEQTINTLEPRIFNPSLLMFHQKHESYLKEETPLTQYFEILSHEARRQNISLFYYPHLKDLQNVLEKEKAIDFKKANEEQVKALSTLPKEDLGLLALAQKETQNSPFKLGAGDHTAQKAFYTVLEERLGAESEERRAKSREVRAEIRVPSAENQEPSALSPSPSAQYPELFKYFDYLKESEKIDPKALIEERKLLENQIFASLIKT